LSHSLISAPELLPVTSPLPPHASRPLLLVVEGVLDIHFLQLLCKCLRSDLPGIPDLADLAVQGRIVFIPAGGGDLSAWVTRLSPLDCREFYLFDREQHPETALREAVVTRINQRIGCRAALTSKRALENYLHPAAIQLATGLHIHVDDHVSVAQSLICARPEIAAEWPSLSRRTRQRLLNRAKRVLNTLAVQHMTAELLAERDPAGEVLGWFRTLAMLLRF
jgi:putative ATP-dependent endonuclease of OLD family